MRHSYMLLLALWLLPWEVYSQSPVEGRHWRFGVMAGRQFKGKIYETTKMGSARGIIGGLDVSYAFEKARSGPSIHFQPNFSTFEKTETDGAAQSMYYTESKWKWEAVTVPLLVRYTVLGGRVRPFVEAGVSWRFRTGFSVNVRRETCGFAGCYATDTLINIQDIAKQDGFGIQAGGGLEVDVWNVTIPITIRIAESVRRYSGTYDPAVNAASYSNLKTKVVQISAGVVF
ncbi:PorT family protein [Dyadobacter sp. CY261]|uniref:outer membrane beta-barrel protein n=1 Tax=Dyadobacter sp. CY261 TaxID=2907203 RepID=UPI001F46A83C|nr:outer membrane beta-barrel protein [Dyadobacter sp. CY261]MCF0069429.1 PorT family protein [Dyadobacter sp. CY261]